MNGPRSRALCLRFGLTDVMIGVLGAGVGAAVCREMRPWEWSRGTFDVDQGLGLLSVILAILCGTGLLRQALARRRLRRAGGEPAAGGTAWRVAVALLLLGGYPMVEAVLLRDEPGSAVRSDYAREAQRRLLPLSATFAMAGLLAGLAAGPGRARPRRGGWISVAWASAAAVAIAATQVLMPYLVLLALEAVSNAMSRPSGTPRLAGSPMPGLHARIVRAGLAGVPALACTLLLGLLVAHEFRRSTPAGRTGGDRRRGFVLLALSAATALASAWLFSVAIPMLHASLAEGVWATLVPSDAAFVVLGFAGLALGPSIRTANRPEPWEAMDTDEAEVRGSTGFVPRALVLALAVSVTTVIAASLAIGGTEGLSWLFGNLWVAAALDGWWSFAMRQHWMLFLSPHWVVLALLEAWVAWQAIRLLWVKVSTGATPIDACLNDRRRLGRFAARWVALTVLMIAALPVLMVAGLVVLDGVFWALG